MILPRYEAFRPAFAVPAAPTDIDGLPVWPVANLRINGFTNTFTYPVTWALPPDPQPSDPATMTVTCNAQRTDVTDGTTYFWYLSQRTDDATKQALSVTQPDGTKSGTIVISTTTQAPKLVPGFDYTSIDGIAQLFRHTYLYVQRQSDQAIQYVNLSLVILPS